MSRFTALSSCLLASILGCADLPLTRAEAQPLLAAVVQDGRATRVVSERVGMLVREDIEYAGSQRWLQANYLLLKMAAGSALHWPGRSAPPILGDLENAGLISPPREIDSPNQHGSHWYIFSPTDELAAALTKDGSWRQIELCTLRSGPPSIRDVRQQGDTATVEYSVETTVEPGEFFDRLPHAETAGDCTAPAPSVRRTTLVRWENGWRVQ